MATTKKTAKKAVPAAEIKEFAAALNLPVKEGTVSVVRDRYYLTVGQTKQEIPVGELNDIADVRKLAGEKVPVIASGRNIVAVGYPGRIKCYILCYKPAPDFLKQVRPEIRTDLINRFAKAGIINEQIQQELLKGIR